MSIDYSPVVPDPRPIPWVFPAVEAVLAAAIVGVALDLLTLAPAVRAVLFGALALVLVILDVVARTRYAGSGLERSFTQLVVGGFTVLLVVVAVAVVGQQPPLAAGVATMLGAGILVYVVLRWDQRRQVDRARAVAAKRARTET